MIAPCLSSIVHDYIALISKKVESSAAFAWQSQLKHRSVRMETVAFRMTKSLRIIVVMAMIIQPACEGPVR